MSTVPQAPVSGLNEVKNIASLLMKDRQQHLSAAQKIENELIGLRDELDGILRQKVGQPAPKRGRPVTRSPKVRTKRGTATQVRSRGRNGGMSGTQKIEAILEKAPSKKMLSGELAREAEKQGVANPHSSYQSLKRRNRIELKDGFVSLVTA